MENEQSKKKELIKKLKNKYRLVIINDASFEERWSYLLTPLNVFTGIGITGLIFTIFIFGIIAYTPIREWIPGFPDEDIRYNARWSANMADSLDVVNAQRDRYLSNLYSILSGNPPMDSVPPHQEGEGETPIGQGHQHAGEQHNTGSGFSADSALRQLVAEQEKSAAYEVASTKMVYAAPAAKLHFFSPLKGNITSEYNLKDEHFGIDIVAPRDHPIKATLAGTVIFASWTPDAGYVIQIQHDHNYVSVYKHNSMLLKKVGEVVSAGEAVAIIGGSGELSDGPHLHFELWERGRAVDPLNYVVF